jgi:hypothetical protein
MVSLLCERLALVDGHLLFEPFPVLGLRYPEAGPSGDGVTPAMIAVADYGTHLRVQVSRRREVMVVEVVVVAGGD